MIELNQYYIVFLSFKRCFVVLKAELFFSPWTKKILNNNIAFAFSYVFTVFIRDLCFWFCSTPVRSPVCTDNIEGGSRWSVRKTSSNFSSSFFARDITEFSFLITTNTLHVDVYIRAKSDEFVNALKTARILISFPPNGMKKDIENLRACGFC